MRRGKYIVVYPAYLDLTKSRSEGRRVAKRYAVKSPTIQEIIRALEQIGVKYNVEYEKAYPKEWWSKGRILIYKQEINAKGLSKQAFLNILGKKILEFRRRR